MITPVAVAEGTGEPHGKAITSQAEAIEVSGLAGCVHATKTELYNTVAGGIFNTIGF